MKPDIIETRTAGEPPSGLIERRIVPIKELRTEVVDGKTYLTGHAAVFNSLSGNLGGWYERIKPGSFKRAIEEKQEVHHLLNHNENFILGNTAAGTTVISEDSKGLHFRTLVGDRSYDHDVVESMNRGDLSKCSFGFIVPPGGDNWVEERDSKTRKKRSIRELSDVDLVDVSIVGRPAYTETSAEVVNRMFPSGVPLEVRSRMTNPPPAAPAPRADETSGVCDCDCGSCQMSDCAECSNAACDDPNCSQCPMQNKATAAAQAAAEAVAPAAAEAVAAAALAAAAADPANDEMPLIITPAQKTGIMIVRSMKALASQPKVSAMVDAGGTLELLIYGDIGEDYWSYDGGITAGNLKNIIDGAGVFSEIRMRINSFGGDAFEGLAIHNMVKSQGKPVSVFVDGIAASAAAIIAMCGTTITVANNAMMMIHNASSMAYGYASDMRKTADVLDKISEAVAQTFVDRTKTSMESVKTLMDAETWMSATDCIKDGFATAVVAADADTDKALDAVRSSLVAVSYRNLPARFSVEARQAADDKERLRMKIRQLAVAAA